MKVHTEKNLKDLLKDVQILSIKGPVNLPICGISCDSRAVREGWLFVAVKGTQSDGHDFIDEALKRGACAVVGEEKEFSCGKITNIVVRDSRKALAYISDNFYDNPSGKINVIGVTGTNGKTTITYLTEGILKKAGFSTGIIGTISYRFQKRLIPASNTTPGSQMLASLLADMVKEKIDYCIMEVSSHSLSQSRVERINFKAAIFTNVTSEHLDYHKDFQQYKMTKAKLFENLNKDAMAILNIDDEFGRQLQDRLNCNILTYGLSQKADIRAEKFSLSSEGIALVASTPAGRVSIRSALVGRFNVYNILAAISAGIPQSLKVDQIVGGIEDVKFVPGRLQEIDCGQPFKVFVDYAHTDDALKNVLVALRQMCTGRIIAVFGCGGDRDTTKRPRMGKVASELADYSIITTDNPRSEDPRHIADMVTSGIDKDRLGSCSVILDRFEAIDRAIKMASCGDIVLLAGKGHETYQVLKDTVVPFDDREAAARLLSERGSECSQLKKY